MRSATLIAAFGLTTTFASPLPQSGGSTSCKTEDLTADTWNSLKMDDYIQKLGANITDTDGNTIQALAASQGAPNFFCGLDNFCNAGQPCVPVQLPGWYALVAIQNWNSYMNSVNTAITFASSILSLVLPEVVTDLYPDPKDDVTPLKDAIRMFTSVLGVVPLTGTVAKAGSALSGGLNYINGNLQPPDATDKFLAWSSLSSTMSTVVRDFQNAVADSIKTTIDAPVNQIQGGIGNALLKGQFLGTHQNITQQDIQDQVIDSFRIRAAALALQAQKVFIARGRGGDNVCSRDPGAAGICITGDDGVDTSYNLLKLDSKGNAEPQVDIANTLTSKYGLTKENIITDVTKCFDDNGKVQLADGFDKSLPLDSKTPCLFILNVCDTVRDSAGITTPKGDGFKEICATYGIEL
ncbi:hypothetical protein CSOJ01_07085 [Colletotrichum sojae]|uniref:DUF7872 domain-containing protein n=1 Tax=Colletotrichum sojae TaxID=2175907 RepID=A0A8H6MU90_9PEZI|nr:hypothetical protein CSOJ01_07085 [Colletotrichum sojae]